MTQKYDKCPTCKQQERADAEQARAVDQHAEMFAEAIDELARRATDPEWGKTAALVEEKDEERIAWMLGYLRKNVGELAVVWLERAACEEEGA